MSKKEWPLNIKNFTFEELAKHIGSKWKAKKRLSGIRHQVKRGDNPVRKGFDGEEFLSKKLTSMGISNELMPFHHPFDILLGNGKRIEVKTESIQTKPPSQYSGYYDFRLRELGSKNLADYYAFVLSDIDVVYIIPYDKVPPADKFRVYADHKKKSKYQQYRNAFNLLK